MINLAEELPASVKWLPADEVLLEGLRKLLNKDNDNETTGF